MIELIIMVLLLPMVAGIILFLGFAYIISVFLKYKYTIIIGTLIGLYIIHYMHCWILKKLIFLMEQKEKNK